MKVLQSIKNNIPNAITSLNLFSGALACVYALTGNTLHGSFTGYEIAFIFIIIAAFFDFCDGLVARLLDTVSPIGKELDSLSDCISFGLAPAMLVFTLFEEYNPDSVYNYSAFLIAIFGALRLAKFNVDTTQTVTFKGLPIPANAVFWIGYNSFCNQRGSIGIDTYICIAVLSLLMVCNIPMFSFKMKDFGLKNNWHRYLLVVLVIAFLALFGVTGLFYSTTAYVLISLLKK